MLVAGVVKLGEDVEAVALGEAAEDGDEGAVGGAETEALASVVELHEARVAGEPEGFGGEVGGGVEADDGVVELLLGEAGDELNAFGLGLAGVVTDVPAGVFAEGGEEGVEGGGKEHAVARGEGFHTFDFELRNADLALVGGKEAQVK